MTLAQADIDYAYAEGKRAWLRVFGTHGPTLRQRTAPNAINPYSDPILREAWRRGYVGSVRRLILAEREHGQQKNH